MFWLCLEAQSETAIALPRRAEAGNLYETVLEIPGSAMRGAFAGQYIHQHGNPKDSGDKVFERWFENPAIRCRVNDFVRGALLITPSEKPPKLKAQFSKGEEEKGNE